MGDPTAKKQGRLSLNPLRHIDIMGLVMMAVCHFGWAKPVPVVLRQESAHIPGIPPPHIATSGYHRLRRDDRGRAA